MKGDKYDVDARYLDISQKKLQSISNEVLKRLSRVLYGITYYSFGQDPGDPNAILIEVGCDGLFTAFGVKANFAIAVSVNDIAQSVVRSLSNKLETMRSDVDEAKSKS